MGVDGFLMKPFGIEALTTTVEEVLAGKPRAKPQIREEVATEPGGPTPKAKLLFVEPEYIYKLKEIYFTNPQECGGKYEVALADSSEDVQGMLENFRPDILLVDLTMLGPSGDLAMEVMKSPFRPKELIIHGSGAAVPANQNAKVQEMSRQGVKVVYNESFTRSGLIRLGSVIRKTAVANGLVDGSA